MPLATDGNVTSNLDKELVGSSNISTIIETLSVVGVAFL